MRRKLSLAAVCILILPFVFSSSVGGERTNSNQLNTVAFAGHIIPSGVYCECDTPQCFCEPGETRAASQTTPSHPSTDGANLASATPANSFDLGVGVMLFTLALLLGLRMRF